MHALNVQRLISAIEEPDLIQSTYVASDHSLVSSIILRAEAVQTVLAYLPLSAPYILERYFATKEEMTDEVRLIYFILFGQLQRKVVIPELCSFVLHTLSTLSVGGTVIFFPWNPFFYAIDALAVLTNQRLPPLTIELFEEQMDAYLAGLTEWYARTYRA